MIIDTATCQFRITEHAKTRYAQRIGDIGGVDCILADLNTARVCSKKRLNARWKNSKNRRKQHRGGVQFLESHDGKRLYIVRPDTTGADDSYVVLTVIARKVPSR